MKYSYRFSIGDIDPIHCFKDIQLKSSAKFRWCGKDLRRYHTRSHDIFIFLDLALSFWESVVPFFTQKLRILEYLSLKYFLCHLEPSGNFFSKNPRFLGNLEPGELFPHNFREFFRKWVKLPFLWNQLYPTHTGWSWGKFFMWVKLILLYPQLYPRYLPTSRGENVKLGKVV